MDLGGLMNLNLSCSLAEMDISLSQRQSNSGAELPWKQNFSKSARATEALAVLALAVQIVKEK